MHLPRLRSRWLAVTSVVAALAGAFVVADPAFAQTVREGQWHLRSLDVAGAHRLTSGAGVVVAVVDTGVSPHPDLTGQLLDGANLLSLGNRQVDGAGHGTAMASVIAAKGGAPDRLLGIAPGAKILPVKVSVGEMGIGGYSLIGAGVRWAADHGAKVINISGGGPRLPADTVDAVRYAMEKDAVVVASTGNRDPKAPDLVGVAAPANYPGVLAVAATDREGRVVETSMRGPEVALAAPGADLPVAVPALDGTRAGYRNGAGGTSVAAAVVSGAAALVRARHPQLRAHEVIQRLIATADDAGPAGRDPDYGFGRLNLGRALTAEVPPVSSNPLITAGSSASPGGSAQAGPSAGRNPARLPVGLIVGAIVGCGLVTIVVVGMVTWLVLRRRRRAPV